MNLSKRELNLGMATLGVLLLGLLYVVVEGQWKQWQETREQADLLNRKLTKLERLYAQKDRLPGKFNELMPIFACVSFG